MANTQQLHLKRLRFSKEADTWLRVLKSRTGITPNLLCRMAFCISLEEPGTPDVSKCLEDSDREINRYTLLGEYDEAFVALLRQWLRGREQVEASLDKLFAAHVHRGIVLLAARIKELSDLGSLGANGSSVPLRPQS